MPLTHPIKTPMFTALRRAPAERATTRRCAEFFAGIGLMRLGLEAADWSVVFANDISEDKASMYLANFDDDEDHFALDDIHLLRAHDVPTVELATASFPCNDLSLAGMRGGLNGRQSSAFWGFMRILEEMGDRRPPIVLLENVAGFLTSHQGKDFQSALSSLNDLGYAVDAVFLDAQWFLPQSRVRLFVVGAQADMLGSLQKPSREAPCRVTRLRPRALANFIAENRHLIWNLQDLPDPPLRSHVTLSEIIEDPPERSPEWWSRERVDYLINQMSKRHSSELESLRSKRKWTYCTVFRRIRNARSMAELRTDGIAGCLRTPRGGSGRQIVVKTGYDQVKARLLTPRECARLMGANDYRIETSLNRALFGFGDAVCVPVVTWLAINYLNPIWAEMRCNIS